MGRLVFFMERAYWRNRAPKLKSFFDDEFGVGWCDALISIGWGKEVNKRFFVFSPPSDFEHRGPKHNSGKSILNGCTRDAYGRFLKKPEKKRGVSVTRCDAEGNAIYSLKHMGKEIPLDSPVSVGIDAFGI